MRMLRREVDNPAGAPEADKFRAETAALGIDSTIDRVRRGEGAGARRAVPGADTAREGRIPEQVPWGLRVALAAVFLAVVAFAVATVLAG